MNWLAEHPESVAYLAGLLVSWGDMRRTVKDYERRIGILENDTKDAPAISSRLSAVEAELARVREGLHDVRDLIIGGNPKWGGPDRRKA